MVKNSLDLVQFVSIQNSTQNEHCFPFLLSSSQDGSWALERVGAGFLGNQTESGASGFARSMCWSHLQSEVWPFCASCWHVLLNHSCWYYSEPSLYLQGHSNAPDFRCPWVWFLLGPSDRCSEMFRPNTTSFMGSLAQFPPRIPAFF